MTINTLISAGLKGPFFEGGTFHNADLNYPLVIAGTILGISLLRLIIRRLTHPLAKLPGPEISNWTDIVYIYHYFKGQNAYYVQRLHEKYGPIVRTKTTEVDICDGKAVKDIHNIHTKFHKSKFYEPLVGGGPQTTFSTRDPKFHGQRRRLLATAISDSALTKLEDQITRLVSLAVQRIGEEMESRKVADVMKWWLFMTTDVIGELTFGESFRMLESGQKNQYINDLESLASAVPMRVTFPTLLPWVAAILPLPIFTGALRIVERIRAYSTQSLGRYTRMLQEDPNPKQTLFTKLYEKGDLSFEQIRQEGQSYIIAGSDTTSNTLTYLVYAVCTHPEVRDKLAAELAALPDSYSDKDLRELKYLNQVISETLRLWAAAPAGLPRDVPAEGYQFNGYFIPPKTIVTTQAYSLHRDSATFPDPESFKPERWESPTKEMKDMLLPFGGGSRVCIGMHLARIELRLATAMFFRKFPKARVSSRDGMNADDMIMKIYFLINPKGKRCLIEA